jgi:hypothetical protein
MSETTPQVRHRQPNTAQVSRALVSAGHVKAAPYNPFGREREGFLVTHRDRFGERGERLPREAIVLFSRGARPAEEAAASAELTSYADTLDAAGYRVEREKRQSGAVQALHVKYWED